MLSLGVREWEPGSPLMRAWESVNESLGVREWKDEQVDVSIMDYLSNESDFPM